MEDVKELEKKLDLLYDAYDKAYEKFMNMSEDNIPYEVAYKWFNNQEVVKEYYAIKDKIRKIREPKYFDPIESDDDVYPLNVFIGICKSGGFIDYDGFGVYAIEGQKSDIEIYPSDVQKGNVRDDFTYVVWYNR